MKLNMEYKFKKYRSNYKNYYALIDEDLPGVGWNLYIFKDGKGLYDNVQDTLEFCKEDAYEGRRKAGKHQQHRVAKHVPVEHAVIGQALGLCRDHVLFVDLIQKAVFGQQGHGGKVADDQCGDGQRQVPEIVEDLAA